MMLPPFQYLLAARQILLISSFYIYIVFKSVFSISQIDVLFKGHLFMKLQIQSKILRSNCVKPTIIAILELVEAVQNIGTIDSR